MNKKTLLYLAMVSMFVGIVGFILIVPWLDNTIRRLDIEIKDKEIHLDSIEGNMELADYRISIAREYHSAILTSESLGGDKKIIELMVNYSKGYYRTAIETKYFSVHNNTKPSREEWNLWGGMSLEKLINLSNEYTERMIVLQNKVHSELIDLIEFRGKKERQRYIAYTISSVSIILGTFIRLIAGMLEIKQKDKAESF